MKVFLKKIEKIKDDEERANKKDNDLVKRVIYNQDVLEKMKKNNKIKKWYKTNKWKFYDEKQRYTFEKIQKIKKKPPEVFINFF